ncbi:MAG: lipocalin-like domain-containing protein [Gammaproteobacteria bacterium]
MAGVTLNRALRWLLVASAAALAVAVVGRWSGEPANARDTGAAAREEFSRALASALRADSRDGFDKPAAPWSFEFPRDHGAHPQFRSENWYVGALLEDDDGYTVSLQLTLSRLALVPPGEAARNSAWAVRDVYRAELELLDGQRAVHAERTVRGALGLGGHSHEPVRTWTGDWSLQPRGDEGSWLVEAQADGIRIALELAPAKPLLLPRTASGDGPAPPFTGYAMTRFDVSGSLQGANGERSLIGEGWLEHGFGELPLPGGAVALDRWRLILADGRELSVNTLRRRDGSGKARISAVLVEPNGEVRTLDGTNIEIQPLAYWRAEHGDRRYPVQWRIVAPALDLPALDLPALDLNVHALGQDREIRGPLRRWSGPVTVKDNERGGETVGRGFVESWGVPAT